MVKRSSSSDRRSPSREKRKKHSSSSRKKVDRKKHRDDKRSHHRRMSDQKSSRKYDRSRRSRSRSSTRSSSPRSTSHHSRSSTSKHSKSSARKSYSRESSRNTSPQRQSKHSSTKQPSAPQISASEKLKRDVLTVIQKSQANKSNQEERNANVVNSISASILSEIDSGTFKQESFKSSYNKPKGVSSSETTGSLSLISDQPTLAALNAPGRHHQSKKDTIPPEIKSIFNEQLFMDEEKKLASWMKLLTEYRKEFFSCRKQIIEQQCEQEAM